MKGWIFGSTTQKQWIQKIYRHSVKFQNPLHQNYKHVKTLAALLDIEETFLHSVIVFVGASIFKTALPEKVTSGLGYIWYIKSQKLPVLSDVDVEDIVGKISSDKLSNSFSNQRAHVNHVKTIMSAKVPTSSFKTCPRCGNAMVLRESKSGKYSGNQFLGCSSFPRCRVTVNTA